ncbi:MAG: class I SAM-dependent DNA methyltransferase [Alphaproteobacteria bacterium]
MALSWNEIRSRALKFSNDFTNAHYEKGETQTFYNEFFNVFGVNRRRVATFEEPVKKFGDKQGFIDLLWKGMLLVEQKSEGRDLTKAKKQALDYFPGLKDNELPQYVLACDFQNFELYDLDNHKEYKFKLSELSENIEHFGFLAGYEKKEYKDFQQANIEASELMGKLYDQLKESGYIEHDLELFLVRILFCLFADDTGIFTRDSFKFLIEERTNVDGSDTGMWLTQLFEVLNTPEDKRQKNLDEDLAAFPYINGSLFDKSVRIPSFDSKMRKALLDCCYYTWNGVSPAIFGSLFQCVADKEKRRTLGEHYTTEKNIMKTISPLFLDDLKAEFEKLKNDRSTAKNSKLKAFQQKLAKLRFLDPACGCGNFLVIAYRELRQLELDVLKELYMKKGQIYELFDVERLSLIDVDNFYGIEIEEFPAKIAEVALWICDHQMNIELSKAFGQYFARIPLRKTAHILCGNALTTDWKELVSPKELSYILGNPPFIGARMKSEEQAEEMQAIFHDVKGWGDLDYVTAWYMKAAQYIQNTKIKVAFVSTNSITQGIQAGILWGYLFQKYNIKIHFAHRTFIWDSEASGKAHVHCVIIGFASYDTDKKRIFDYQNIKGDAHELTAKNINQYLVDFKDIIINKRMIPICKVPDMTLGSMPNDGGNLIIEEKDYKSFVKNEPLSKKYVKLLLGAEEFINNKKRYCLWLKDANPTDIAQMPLVKERIEKVKQVRIASKRKETRDLAKFPMLFGEIRQPNSKYIIIPQVSSENRDYIPIGFLNKTVIVNNRCSIIPSGDLFLFGVLTSIMHMTWVRYVCGRLKSDYNYSNSIVYNNFPWPLKPTDKQKEKVKELAQKVLDIRAKYPGCSLAILYNPETMPADLVKAHDALDKAVDACYGKKSFNNEAERMEFLFNLYEQYTAPLAIMKKVKNKGKR